MAKKNKVSTNDAKPTITDWISAVSTAVIALIALIGLITVPPAIEKVAQSLESRYTGSYEHELVVTKLNNTCYITPIYAELPVNNMKIPLSDIQPSKNNIVTRIIPIDMSFSISYANNITDTASYLAGICESLDNGKSYIIPKTDAFMTIY